MTGEAVKFATLKQACKHVVHLTPAVLRKTIRSTSDTHLATEVSDGERTLAVIRAKVLIEKRAPDAAAFDLSKPFSQS
jgi:hypothetical protein